MEEYKHWAEALQVGDRCLATIRDKTDGSKNMINVNCIVVDNTGDQHVLVEVKHSGLFIVPYNELKQLP